MSMNKIMTSLWNWVVAWPVLGCKKWILWQNTKFQILDGCTLYHRLHKPILFVIHDSWLLLCKQLRRSWYNNLRKDWVSLVQRSTFEMPGFITKFFGNMTDSYWTSETSSTGDEAWIYMNRSPKSTRAKRKSAILLQHASPPSRCILRYASWIAHVRTAPGSIASFLSVLVPKFWCWL